MSLNGHTVKESQINITLEFKVVQGALICAVCDLYVQNSSLIFVATGQKISGIMLEGLQYIEIQLTFIQFRITSKQSSGIVNLVNQSNLNLTITDSRLAGSNLLYSEYCGYIAVGVLSTITVSINTFYVCVNNISRFGYLNATVIDHGSETTRCDVCGIQTVVYGLCADQLVHATLVNGTLQCLFPFEFVDNQCVCVYGHLLNGSVCVNIIDEISSSAKYPTNDTELEQMLQNITNIENLLIELDSSILNNVSNFSGMLNSTYSNLEQYIINNFSLADTNLLTNTTAIDQRIFDNISSLVAVINSNISQLETFIVSNATTLDWRIFYNMSNLSTHIQNQTQIIQQFYNDLQKLKQQIECSKIFGNQIVNGSCVKVICSIIGQFSINGVCQCPKNAVLNNGQCQCPANLKIIGFECTCDTGLPMQSGQCSCSTPGAFVQAGSCTCGVNSLNISNACSCPSGSTLQAGECKCTNTNAYISGSSCVCPTFSTLIDSTCTCPNFSSLIGNTCICDVIADQIMVSEACKCSTPGAFVDAGICTCGVNSLNISNACSCPSGSVLQAGECTCTDINAFISGTSCICPTFSTLINSTCTCPAYSTVIGTSCVCNQVVDQTMAAGVCECTTSGAFVKSGDCTCGVDSLNVSNSCRCPVNSTLVAGACTCNIISGQVMGAGFCKCHTQGAFIDVSSCTCGINGLNISNQCSCPENSTLVGNTCKCTVNAGESMVLGACKCPPDYIAVDRVCLQNYTINEAVSSLSCSQIIYTIYYDMQTVTHQITDFSNFNSGYVFSSTNVVNNAFVDIQNSVYSPIINPLFQSQSSFTNIKVQIGAQAASTGSILTQSSTIIINQVNIISKTGTQITVGSSLSIMLLSTSSTIKDLLVNLNFNVSSGNITLIKSISGVFNIIGYLIQGCYQSTQTVAMIGLNINSATVIINDVTFKPNIYNVGNCSSYLLSYIVQSSLSISKIGLMLGNNTDYQIANSITSTVSNYYKFGGIVADQNLTTTIIDSIIQDSYQLFNTDQIQYTGLFIGNSQNVSSNIIITKACILQKIRGTNQQCKLFGFVGKIDGNISFKESSVIFIIQTKFLNIFGIVGQIASNSLYSEVNNVEVTMNIILSTSTSSYTNVGSIFGTQSAINGIIQNVYLIGNNISTYSYGGMIGASFSLNYTIQNITIQQYNISGAGTQIGILFGASSINNLTVKDIVVVSSNISAINQVGAICGAQTSTAVYILNVSITLTSYYVQTAQCGGFFGSNYGNVTISNSLISFCNISGQSAFIGKLQSSWTVLIQNCTAMQLIIKSGIYIGGFYGISADSNISISNSLIQQSNLTATSFSAGGFIGECSQSKNTIQNSKISFVRITCPTSTPNKFGLIIGYNNPSGTGNAFSFSGSSSTNYNYVNGAPVLTDLKIYNYQIIFDLYQTIALFQTIIIIHFTYIQFFNIFSSQQYYGAFCVFLRLFCLKDGALGCKKNQKDAASLCVAQFFQIVLSSLVRLF
ncbi:Conserved_hypothetical protein [Hexamita inflata]|uniref:Uncharacterized protein n=1 Tax=Hexamita inflata TaxID=28002 RepID=A0AA86QK31_9EUKA|nr:Conserved hypothetical protein [Hexamita inflata]